MDTTENFQQISSSQPLEDFYSQHSVSVQQAYQQPAQILCPEVLLAFKRMAQRMVAQLPEGKKRSNYNGSGLRIFKVTDVYKQDFISNDQIRQVFGAYLSACYIFRFRIECDTYTHGLYLRLNGYATRRTFDVFANSLIDAFTMGKSIQVKSVTPQMRKNISIFDYLQSLYVLDQNLIVNYASQMDAVPFSVQMLTHQQHQELANLTQIMKRATQTIIDNMIQMPSMYSTSQLFQVLQFQPDKFKAYMRMTTINEFVMQLCQFAYNIALQSQQLSTSDIQQLMDPLTRRSLINQISNDRIVKAVQMLLQQRFQLSFVHPHPYINISRSELGMQRPFDGILFDPRFLLPLLMCSRWFAKTCMRQENFVQNNQAHLMLYGLSGAGKSFLLSILSSNIPTYRYLTTSRFQNPEILSSSMFYIEEFDSVQLTSNQYKSLLDIKAPVKVDLKNLHPENVSEGVPCMISTNDEVFSVLRNLPNRRAPTGNQHQVNQSSVEAALRRLYIVPVKLGQYDKLHAKLPLNSKYPMEIMMHNNSFEQEPNKLNRIFNFIMAFALFQQDISGFEFDPKLQYYFTKLVSDFSMTVFGMFYATYKKRVDDLLIDVEKAMVQPEINDTEYLCQIALAASGLQGMMVQFLMDMTNLNTRVNQNYIKDNQIPWPIRMYYLKSDHAFVTKVQCQCNDFHQFLNQEVLSFIADRSIEPFKIEEDTYYQDIESSSSNGECFESLTESAIAAVVETSSLAEQFIEVQQRPALPDETEEIQPIIGAKRSYSMACEPTLDNDRTVDYQLAKRVRLEQADDFNL